MRIARQIGLLLVTVCALGAMAVSSASAGTPLFLFHGTGGKLLGGAGNVQTLTTVLGAVNCTALQITQGTATALRLLSLLVTVKYTGCTVEGAGEVTIHPVQYVIDANGLVKLENNAEILVPALACTITLPAAKNQGLENAVSFANTAANKGILLSVKATGIAYSGCGAGEQTNGTARGEIHVTADGGLLKWDLNA